MNLVDELHAVAAVLTRERIAYAVCGGVAVSAHGAPRTTKDIDIVVGRADLARSLEAVRAIGYAFPALPMVFEEGTPRERHVQRVSKVVGKEHLLLDFLIDEVAFAGALDDRVEVTLPEGPISLVSLPSLLRLKRLAGRPQDLIDLERLEALDGT